MKAAPYCLILVVLTLTSCSKDPEYPDLVRAAATVEQVVAPFFAQKSSFFVVFPNGTPRQFVSWYFSTMGTAEWAPVEGSDEFRPEELEALQRMGMKSRPGDVLYRHTRPDTTTRKQLVLRWDDAEGTVILEGYLDPLQPPVMTRSFKLPKAVVSDQVTRMITESNLEMGMRSQAF
jgi:hypothetical protein